MPLYNQTTASSPSSPRGPLHRHANEPAVAILNRLVAAIGHPRPLDAAPRRGLDRLARDLGLHDRRDAQALGLGALEAGRSDPRDELDAQSGEDTAASVHAGDEVEASIRSTSEQSDDRLDQVGVRESAQLVE